MDTDATTLHNSDEHEIRALLTDRRITSVEDNILTLDDGTCITVLPDNSTGIGHHIEHTLDHLASYDNRITRVQFVNKTYEGDDNKHPHRTYQIFVYSSAIKTKNKGKQKLIEVNERACSSTGYLYGMGFQLIITPTT